MELLPGSESAARVRRIQQWMRETETDAVFVLQSADLYYFSGTIQAGVLCLHVSEDPVYMVQKSQRRARLESPIGKVTALGGLRKMPDILAGERVPALNKIALEMDVLPANLYLRFHELFPRAEFVDASEAIRKIRMTKSAFEVDRVRRAALLLKEAFQELCGWVRPRATELEILAKLEGFLRSHGHQGLTRMRAFNYEISYGTISSGPSASHPTYFPGPVGFVGLYPAIPNGGSRRVLIEGDTVMADIVGGYAGYIADKTRTFAIGKIAPDLEKAHAFVLDLMSTVRSMLKPGVSCERIYGHAMEIVKDSPYSAGFMGCGDSQVRFLGHGVGLELDELPVLAAGFDIPLEPGMTIAIEPKIFFPDRGGVGIEDTYLITDSGYEILTDFPEEILRIT